MVDLVFIGWLVALAAIIFIFRKSVEWQFPVLLIKSKRLGKLVYDVSKRWYAVIAPLSDLGIVVGFIGMAFCVYFLVKSLITVLTPKGAAAVSIIVPGVHVPGSPIFLPFTYGIISITLLALVHEFAHGVVASTHGVKPKSIAIAFFLFIPAAGVEIDERKLAKKSLRTKLRIFAAGSFANFLFALLILGLSFGVAAMTRPHILPAGTEIIATEPGTGAFGVVPNGTVIVSIDGKDVTKIEDFIGFAAELKPAQQVTLVSADGKEYTIATIVKPGNESQGKIGITTRQKVKYDSFGNAALWFLGLFQWLFSLNVGVGVINLFPFPIMDGGRMASEVINEYFDKKLAKRLVLIVYWLAGPLLALNLLIPIAKSLFFK